MKRYTLHQGRDTKWQLFVDEDPQGNLIQVSELRQLLEDKNKECKALMDKAKKEKTFVEPRTDREFTFIGLGANMGIQVANEALLAELEEEKVTK